ncbi:MAG: MIP family channel protein [Methanomicrobiales archaeon]|nr:MIP family channel protein [Methanomicrobiales archaeon]
MSVRLNQKYTAEMFGTFALVLVGLGSAVLGGSQVGNLGIALAFGLTLMTMVYAIGDISGCHVNPAVTVGVLAAGKIPLKEAVAYIVMQCLGALLGAGALLVIAMGNPDYSLAVDGLGANGYGALSPGGYSLLSGFLVEVLMTGLFVFVILSVTCIDELKRFAGLAIGMALTMVILAALQVTGAAINPARSLGPAVFVGGEALMQLWLFWVAPILGAVFAVVVWRYLMAVRATRPIAVATAAQSRT